MAGVRLPDACPAEDPRSSQTIQQLHLFWDSLPKHCKQEPQQGLTLQYSERRTIHAGQVSEAGQQSPDMDRHGRIVFSQEKEGSFHICYIADEHPDEVNSPNGNDNIN